MQAARFFSHELAEKLFYTVFLLLTMAIVSVASLGLAWTARVLVLLYQLRFGKPAGWEGALTPGGET